MTNTQRLFALLFLLQYLANHAQPAVIDLSQSTLNMSPHRTQLNPSKTNSYQSLSHQFQSDFSSTAKQKNITNQSFPNVSQKSTLPQPSFDLGNLTLYDLAFNLIYKDKESTLPQVKDKQDITISIDKQKTPLQKNTIMNETQLEQLNKAMENMKQNLTSYYFLNNNPPKIANNNNLIQSHLIKSSNIPVLQDKSQNLNEANSMYDKLVNNIKKDLSNQFNNSF